MTTRNFHKQSLLSIFVSYFRPHMGLFLLDMACALMISLIDLAFPYVSRLCMYELIPDSRYQAFFSVIAILLAAYLLRAGLQYVVCYWGHTFGVLVEADIRKDLFSHLQTLSFGFYDKNRTGHLMSRMTAELFDITELAGGPVHLRRDSGRGNRHHVHHPVAARPGDAPAHPDLPGGHQPQPPQHDPGLPAGQAEYRQHQRGH